VVDGNITLGMMMSISYIIGQLSGPIGQVIGFAQSLQDAKISLERLNEVQNKEDEEQPITTKSMLSQKKKPSVWKTYASATMALNAIMSLKT